MYTSFRKKKGKYMKIEKNDMFKCPNCDKPLKYTFPPINVWHDGAWFYFKNNCPYCKEVYVLFLTFQSILHEECFLKEFDNE